MIWTANRDEEDICQSSTTNEPNPGTPIIKLGPQYRSEIDNDSHTTPWSRWVNNTPGHATKRAYTDSSDIRITYYRVPHSFPILSLSHPLVLFSDRFRQEERQYHAYDLHETHEQRDSGQNADLWSDLRGHGFHAVLQPERFSVRSRHRSVILTSRKADVALQGTLLGQQLDGILLSQSDVPLMPQHLNCGYVHLIFTYWWQQWIQWSNNSHNTMFYGIMVLHDAHMALGGRFEVLGEWPMQQFYWYSTIVLFRQ